MKTTWKMNSHLKNAEDFKEEENLIKEDDHKNKDDFKNEDKLKNEDNLKKRKRYPARAYTALVVLVILTLVDIKWFWKQWSEAKDTYNSLIYILICFANIFGYSSLF